ncbi:MAG: hypothetical protein GQF41_1654 [Candidatus Rifleibacterium amylolyticum]|nr:MAG: hypothetical protein GQF41_1654 [Candidatus Rifleibacterium amylolyticum]
MKEATDLGIGAAVRRELAGRRVDLGKIKFPVNAGVVTLQGELAFVGIEKTVDEIAIELKFIESSIRKVAGVKDLVFELDNWSKGESGTWESSNQPQASASGTSASNIASGDGLYCDECDMVIRFCPCCGKPLAASAKGSGRPRRPIPPVKPIIKRKPMATPSAPANIGLKKEPAPIPAPVAAAPPVISAPQAPAFPPTGQVQPIPATPAPISPAIPAAPATPARPVTPVAPVVPQPATTKTAMPSSPAAPTTKPAPAAPPMPAAPARPAENMAKPAVSERPVQTQNEDDSSPAFPAAKPAEKPAITPARPVHPAAAPPKPAPAKPAPAPRPAAPPPPPEAVDESMNLDNLNLDLDAPAVTATAPTPAESGSPAVPTPDFMKQEGLGDDLFGSLIDNLSQSGKETSDETLAQNAANQSSTTADAGVPDINLDSLDNFSAPAEASPEPELPLDDLSDLLPPMKPAPAAPKQPPQPAAAPAADEFADDLADLLPPMKPEAKPTQPAKPAPAPRPAPAKPAPAKEPDPFASLDDTPLPPMKPADEATGFEDDDTPLPPMKPKTSTGKESKDPFAALFSEADLGLGTGSPGGEGGKDPFASLDLDLDVLEVFPSDDQPAAPAAPAKPAAGGKKPAAGKPAAPVDDNPFNLDNIIDLDSPVEEKPKGGKKPAKDPFDLDDFDIGKFKL